MTFSLWFYAYCLVCIVIHVISVRIDMICILLYLLYSSFLYIMIQLLLYRYVLLVIITYILWYDVYSVVCIALHFISELTDTFWRL